MLRLAHTSDIFRWNLSTRNIDIYCGWYTPTFLLDYSPLYTTGNVGGRGNKEGQFIFQCMPLHKGHGLYASFMNRLGQFTMWCPFCLHIVQSRPRNSFFGLFVIERKCRVLAIIVSPIARGVLGCVLPMYTEDPDPSASYDSVNLRSTRMARRISRSVMAGLMVSGVGTVSCGHAWIVRVLIWTTLSFVTTWAWCCKQDEMNGFAWMQNQTCLLSVCNAYDLWGELQGGSIMDKTEAFA